MSVDDLCPATCELEGTPTKVDYIRNEGLFYCMSCTRFKACPLSTHAVEGYMQQVLKDYKWE
jgi:hypothetical protein